jgi:hypothetical protein
MAHQAEVKFRMSRPRQAAADEHVSRQTATAAAAATASHDPTILERLTFAHDSMTIARFVARHGLETSLARKELSRARMEVTRVIRALEEERARADRPEIDEMLERSRQLCSELCTITAELSTLN